MPRISAAIATLLLAACAPATGPFTLEDKLRNPLFAEFYYDDLVDQIVALQINEDPALQDATAKNEADTARRKALQSARDAVKLQGTGKMGNFVQAGDFTQGEVLLLDGTLYFHPQFLTTPGVDARVLLSNIIDPRDADFPDISAIDLGPLYSPYGDQWYSLPSPADDAVRSVVLWDKALNRIIGFAQLHAR